MPRLRKPPHTPSLFKRLRSRRASLPAHRSSATSSSSSTNSSPSTASPLAFLRKRAPIARSTASRASSQVPADATASETSQPGARLHDVSASSVSSAGPSNSVAASDTVAASGALPEPPVVVIDSEDLAVDLAAEPESAEAADDVVHAAVDVPDAAEETDADASAGMEDAVAAEVEVVAEPEAADEERGAAESEDMFVAKIDANENDSVPVAVADAVVSEADSEIAVTEALADDVVSKTVADVEVSEPAADVVGSEPAADVALLGKVGGKAPMVYGRMAVLVLAALFVAAAIVLSVELVKVRMHVQELGASIDDGMSRAGSGCGEGVVCKGGLVCGDGGVCVAAGDVESCAEGEVCGAKEGDADS